MPAIATQQNKNDTDAVRLTWTEKLGYGLGDFGSNIVWGMSITFLLYFYTDVFGISAAAAGTLLLVARIFDAILDPVMGLITERVTTRWGKFRPYLLFGTPLLGILLVLTFTTPNFSTRASCFTPTSRTSRWVWFIQSSTCRTERWPPR